MEDCHGKSSLQQEDFFFSTSKFYLNLRKKLVKFYIWSIDLCGADTTATRKVDRKYVESFEMWCWRRMEKVSWTDHVGNEVLQ